MKIMLKLFGVFLAMALLLLIIIFQIPLKKQSVATENWTQLIPSEDMPENVRCLNSNNNLDLIQFKDKFYVAFRTSPTHFASKKTALYVVSTKDFYQWSFEHEIRLDKDQREPRFVEFEDKLFLYFFEAGSHPLKFEPMRLLMTSLDSVHGWNKEYVDVELPHFVPWRIKNYNNTLYLSAYNGKGLYGNAEKADLRIFTSTDGHHFQPISEAAQSDWQGSEEAAFTFDLDSNLWANIRLEGNGSLLCYGDKENIAAWNCTYSKYKYDSAIMFNYLDKIYMISRRNIDGTAAKYKRRWLNLLRYSITKKKTALFELDATNKVWIHLLDFPSTGDNAFPAISFINPSEVIVLNYSSDIHGKEKNWIRGQLGKTYIYGSLVDMENLTTRPLQEHFVN